MSIRWDPRLAIGVKAVDEQHEEIFRRVGALLDAMKAGRAKEELAQMVGFLEQYVVQHFRAEEARMLEAGWPHLQAHVAEHRKFAADFQALKGRFDADGATTGLVVELSSFVSGWLGRHIAGPDRAFGRYLTGGKPTAVGS